VIVEYFDSNEMMYTKIQAGDAYDILVPSDYMIERLLANNALQPIDKEMISNINWAEVATVVLAGVGIVLGVLIVLIAIFSGFGQKIRTITLISIVSK